MKEVEGLVEALRYGCVLHPKRWSGDTHDDLGGSIDEAATDALMAQAAAALAEAQAEVAALRERIAQPADAVREAFERWVRQRHGLSVEKWVDSGEYKYSDARRWWECWQAASAQPAYVPAVELAALVAWLAGTVQVRCDDSDTLTIKGRTRTVGELLDEADKLLGTGRCGGGQGGQPAPQPAASGAVAWIVAAGGGYERHLVDDSTRLHQMECELRGNGWEDVTVTPLYTNPPRDVGEGFVVVPVEAIGRAYGYLWHVNHPEDIPQGHAYISADRAAYEGRKELRDLLTNEQRGAGITWVREKLLTAASGGKAGA